MEERAKSVGMADHLHYMWPDTHYIGEDLNQSMLARANALGLKDRLVMDLHTGHTGGVPLAKAFFDNETQTGGGGAGAVNAEVAELFCDIEDAYIMLFCFQKIEKND